MNPSDEKKMLEKIIQGCRNSIKQIEARGQAIDAFPCNCDKFFCSWLCGFSRDYCKEWKK